MRVPLLLATNDKYVPHCRVALASLLAFASPENEYVIYIFHNGLTQASMDALAAFARENARVEFRETSQYMHSAMRAVKWYTQETYFRLMAADLLPEEDKIVYLDCDIVALEDVAHLYAVDMGDALLGMVPDPPRCGAGMSRKLGVDVDLTFNAGVLLCNLAQWRKIGLYEKSMEALDRFQGRLLYQDQDALAIVCSHRTMVIDRRWNGLTCYYNRRGVLQDGIAHLFSAYKPWNSSGDSNYALYYDWARRVGVLPPPFSDKPVSWARRRFKSLRPSWLRAPVWRLADAAYAVASAYVPRFFAPLKCVRVAVTARCPRACAHCELFCAQERPEIDIERLLGDLDKLLKRVRYIEELRLTGGEPLARPELARVLRRALESGRVRRVVVETPGVAAPEADVLALLKDERVRVEVHGGVDVALCHWADDPPVDDAAAAALRALPNAEASREWSWAEYGPFERRDASAEELYWQGRACGGRDLFFEEGRLFACARMARGLALGKIPESACRFVDIRREKSAWRVARGLESLSRGGCAEACRYCLRGTLAFVPVPREA